MQLEIKHPNDLDRAPTSRDEYALQGPELEQLLARVHASLHAERGLRGRLRALPTRLRSLLVGAAVALVMGGILVFARRVDFAAYPRWRLLLNAATYAGLLALVSNLVLRPLHRRAAAASYETALVAACLVAPFCWASAPLPGFFHGIVEPAAGRDCVVVGLTLGTALVVLLCALDRAPRADFRSAALFAAGAGMVANLALLFHCPRTIPLHLAFVHAPIGLLLLLPYWVVLGFAKWEESNHNGIG